jgi:hypothetical protein
MCFAWPAPEALQPIARKFRDLGLLTPIRGETVPQIFSDRSKLILAARRVSSPLPATLCASMPRDLSPPHRPAGGAEAQPQS